MNWLPGVVVFVFVCAFRGVLSLKVSHVNIHPTAVQEGGRVVLQCVYDLQKEQLYCIKWYRGFVEFYRYCPSERPPTKAYPFTLFDIDLSHSNSTQVVLRNVRSRLSGNITCEVSADAPAFLTLSASDYMEVVRIPQGGPVIVAEYPTYDVGDVLRVNCTVPPASPSPNITLFVNDKMINFTTIVHREVDKGLFQTHLTASFQLMPDFFKNGPPLVICSASILNMYSKSAELVLSTKRGPPHLERVISNGCLVDNSHKCLQIFLIVFLYYMCGIR